MEFGVLAFFLLPLPSRRLLLVTDFACSDGITMFKDVSPVALMLEWFSVATAGDDTVRALYLRKVESIEQISFDLTPPMYSSRSTLYLYIHSEN